MTRARHHGVLYGLAGVVGAAAGAVAMLSFWPATKPASPIETVPMPALEFKAPATTTAPGIAMPLAQFASFIDAFKREAGAKGLTPATIDAALMDLAPDAEVLELAANQPEYVKTAGAYLSLLVSDTRLDSGRLKLKEQAATLAAVEAFYGVDRNVVLAIWGVESNYGAAMGVRRIVRSLATLAAYEPRRPDFWKAELLAALRILQSGDTAADNMVGSWAGAMGHTQFMPSTYAVHAVDFDRDGRRDIWATIPDALASTANYLKASGWIAGTTWGFEVQLPAAFDFSLSLPGLTKSWTQWRELGVGLLPARSELPTPGPWQLILPAGARGPAFLVSGNFRAILRYNNSVSYALAVGHLADRLAGGAALVTPWPTDDKALAKADREELQRRLSALGYGAGPIDGVIGVDTRAAIRAFQKAKGLPEDGHADLALVELLRQEGNR